MRLINFHHPHQLQPKTIGNSWRGEMGENEANGTMEENNKN